MRIESDAVLYPASGRILRRKYDHLSSVRSGDFSVVDRSGEVYPSQRDQVPQDLYRGQDDQGDRGSLSTAKNTLGGIVDIFIMGEQAFVRFARKGHNANYMLCIGSKQEVDEANDEQIVKMVSEAIAFSEYRSLEISPNPTLH